MPLRSQSRYILALALIIGAAIASTSGMMSASVFGGGSHSLRTGFQFASAKLLGTGIIVGASLQDVVVSVLIVVLDFTLLLAMASVILAGMYLIFSNGDDGMKDKAKKIILYTIIGIIIIVFSRVMVVFVSHFFFSK